MSNEIQTIEQQGYFLLYDSNVSIAVDELNWQPKKTTLDEENKLYALKSYINQLIGFVCGCRITEFTKVRSKKDKDIILSDLQDNPTQFVAFYAVEADPSTRLILDTQTVYVEPNMLVIFDSKRFGNISITTKNVKLLTINVHQYAL